MKKTDEIMKYLSIILDGIGVRYYNKQVESKYRALSLCTLETEDDQFPFKILVDINLNIMGLAIESIKNLDIKKRNETLEAINEFNYQIAYGSTHLSRDNEIHYYIGVSIEGDNNWFSSKQLLDYIMALKIGRQDLLESLIKNNLFSSSVHEDLIAATEG